MSWEGTVYAFWDQAKQDQLFTLTGMNIARCFQDADGMWYFASRELMYYVDPATGLPQSKWTNPFTNETVPVMHVANNPVQGPFGYSDDEWDSGTTVTGLVSFVSDINLFYPNPLFGNESYVPYAPYEQYEGGEYFKYFTPEAALKDPTTASATGETFFTWERTSQWLPWMAMGDRPGYLLYSCTGGAVADGVAGLPAYMREDIEARLPLYAHAPECLLDMADETSWTYFDHHFDAYLTGDQFPVPAPDQVFPCSIVPAAA